MHAVDVIRKFFGQLPKRPPEKPPRPGEPRPSAHSNRSIHAANPNDNDRAAASLGSDVPPLHTYDLLHLSLLGFGGNPDRHTDRNRLSPTNCAEAAAIVQCGLRGSFRCSGHCRDLLDISFGWIKSAFAGVLDESGTAGSWKVFPAMGDDRFPLCCSGSLRYGEISGRDRRRPYDPAIECLERRLNPGFQD